MVIGGLAKTTGSLESLTEQVPLVAEVMWDAGAVMEGLIPLDRERGSEEVASPVMRPCQWECCHMAKPPNLLQRTVGSIVMIECQKGQSTEFLLPWPKKARQCRFPHHHWGCKMGVRRFVVEVLVSGDRPKH